MNLNKKFSDNTNKIKLVKMLRFFYFLAVDNIDFTRKIVKKNWVKTRENVDFLSKLNFWTKI